VSLKLSVEVRHNRQQPIGGITQRLSPAETGARDRLKKAKQRLGVDNADRYKSLQGWPGLSKIPLLRIVSDDTHKARTTNPDHSDATHCAHAGMSELIAPLYTVRSRKYKSVAKRKCSPNSTASIDAAGLEPQHNRLPAATVPPAQGRLDCADALGAATTVPGGANAAQIRFEPRSLSLRLDSRKHWRGGRD